MRDIIGGRMNRPGKIRLVGPGGAGKSTIGALPLVGQLMVDSSRTVTVLPAPLCPRSTSTSPGLTPSDTARSAVVSPNRLTTCESWMATMPPSSPEDILRAARFPRGQLPDVRIETLNYWASFFDTATAKRPQRGTKAYTIGTEVL